VQLTTVMRSADAKPKRVINTGYPSVLQWHIRVTRTQLIPVWLRHVSVTCLTTVTKGHARHVSVTCLNEWDGMTAEERKRLLGAIFESITAGAEGVDRPEPCEDGGPTSSRQYQNRWTCHPTVGAIGAEHGTRTRDKHPRFA
jgi:hypothetical protein